MSALLIVKLREPIMIGSHKNIVIQNIDAVDGDI